MIPVRNIYYMLAYAFQILHEQGYKDVAAEEFETPQSCWLPSSVKEYLFSLSGAYADST